MAYPFFYIESFDPSTKQIVLDEANSKHAIQVLRMMPDEFMHLTDGKGHLITAAITDNHKRHCTVEVKSVQFIPKPERSVSIALSLLKNASRFEWFLEKATEIGVTAIYPFISERTERTHYRMDRLQGILISALLQSQQVWLPVMEEPVQFENLKISQFENTLKLVAHCEVSEKTPFSNFQISKLSNSLMLIGPEGDFTPSEIEYAISNGFQPVSLGDNRLRSETAAIVAATLMKLS
ncbi:MAG: 16S rRNA (uracil(1498)-N(3))-methyltransferase [Chitinophagaceae bacterium]|nr:16S rRNA (uracil(1498)-N(3))-methyltransferase [Chitinophagaceae bacterium]